VVTFGVVAKCLAAPEKHAPLVLTLFLHSALRGRKATLAQLARDFGGGGRRCDWRLGLGLEEARDGGGAGNALGPSIVACNTFSGSFRAHRRRLGLGLGLLGLWRRLGFGPVVLVGQEVVDAWRLVGHFARTTLPDRPVRKSSLTQILPPTCEV